MQELEIGTKVITTLGSGVVSYFNDNGPELMVSVNLDMHYGCEWFHLEELEADTDSPSTRKCSKRES